MYKLPKRFKEKWVIALRSGLFDQTRNRLADQSGYCCLGVACLIAGIPEKNLKGTGLPNGIYNKKQLPKFFYSDANASIITTLTRMNDADGNSFEEIADYIEKEF